MCLRIFTYTYTCNFRIQDINRVSKILFRKFLDSIFSEEDDISEISDDEESEIDDRSHHSEKKGRQSNKFRKENQEFQNN